MNFDVWGIANGFGLVGVRWDLESYAYNHVIANGFGVVGDRLALNWRWVRDILT